MLNASVSQDIREVFKANLSKILERSELSHHDAGRKTGLQQSTVSRLLNGEIYARVDTISAIAEAFGYQPWQLLVPGFDPAKPPKLVDLSPAEVRLIETMRQELRERASLVKLAQSGITDAIITPEMLAASHNDSGPKNVHVKDSQRSTRDKVKERIKPVRKASRRPIRGR